MSRDITTAIIIIDLIAAIASVALIEGFGPRCKRAGFTDAAHERCVLRLSAGGPLYPENIGYRP